MVFMQISHRKYFELYQKNLSDLTFFDSQTLARMTWACRERNGKKILMLMKIFTRKICELLTTWFTIRGAVSGRFRVFRIIVFCVDKSISIGIAL